MAANSTLNLNGRVEKTDVATLLRSVERDKLSGELSFNRQGERIDLYFLFGQLYHAKWSDVTGIDAVSELLTWKTGNYGFTEGIIPAQASISDDIDRILEQGSHGSSQKPHALAPVPVTVVTAPPLSMDGGDFLNDLAPFDLNAFAGVAPFSVEQATPAPFSSPASTPSQSRKPSYATPDELSPLSDRVAPPPPGGGLYRTRLFCLPSGEQMATSLMATGPQLEEELLHLAEIGFTGYVLGGPEADGFATSGICLLNGRFIHAFYHNNNILLEGEKAYRTALDQSGSTARFFWFYELTSETMRAVISLLTPPSRYAHLEVRIIRFKELLRLLNEEGYTGCIRLSIAPNAFANGRPSQLAGERAYMPIYLGNIMGLWTDSNSKLTNDGQLLQRFLAESQAYLDLHTTAPVAEPGLPLEALIGFRAEPALEVPLASNSEGRAIERERVEPPPGVAQLDDDERQLRLIASIGRMESTWTQLQMKGRIDQKTLLLTLAGFANELLSLDESVSGRRGLQDLINRAIKQELGPFRAIFQVLDLAHGRISMLKLLKEFELFQHDSSESGENFFREASRGMRTLIRTCCQYYVSLVHRETVRFECQEMYEVFLQDVVRKM